MEELFEKVEHEVNGKLFSEAKKHVAQILEIDPNNIDGIIYMIHVMRYLNEDSDALMPMCERGLKIDPQDVYCNFTMGTILADRRSYSEAIEHFELVIEGEPQNAPAHYNKALCLQEIRKYAEAISCYKRALEIDSQFLKAKNNIAICFDRLGDQESAHEEFLSALESSPNNAEILNNLGINAKKNGNTEEAILFYKKALEIDPHYSIAYYNFGIAETDNGNVKEAIELFRKSLESNPNNHFATLAIANIQEMEGELEDALKSYLKIKEDRPEFEGLEDKIEALSKLLLLRSEPVVESPPETNIIEKTSQLENDKLVEGKNEDELFEMLGADVVEEDEKEEQHKALPPEIEGELKQEPEQDNALKDKKIEEASESSNRASESVQEKDAVALVGVIQTSNEAGGNSAPDFKQNADTPIVIPQENEFSKDAICAQKNEEDKLNLPDQDLTTIPPTASQEKEVEEIKEPVQENDEVKVPTDSEDNNENNFVDNQKVEEKLLVSEEDYLLWTMPKCLKVLSLSKNDKRALFRKAVIHIQENELFEAKATLENLQSIDKEFHRYEVLDSLGDIYGKLDNNWELVIETYQSILDSDPNISNASDVYLKIGKAYEKIKNFPKAIEAFQKCVEKATDLLFPEFRLGWAYIRNNDKVNSLIHLRKALELDDKNIQVLTKLAEVLFKDPETLEEAISLLKRALELDPKHSEALPLLLLLNYVYFIKIVSAVFFF